MSTYLYTVKKLPKTLKLTNEKGEIVEVNHILRFATANAGSRNAADAARVDRACERACEAVGTTFTGPVVVGNVGEGAVVVEWDGAPSWFDTDLYRGKVVGFLVKSAKSYRLYSSVDTVWVEDSTSTTQVHVEGRGLVPCRSVIKPSVWPTPAAWKVVYTTTRKA